MINLSREPIPISDIHLELFKLLRQHVPDIIITDNSWTVGSFTHKHIIDQIIEQIAWWLFEGDQTEELSKLEKLNSPSSICGHVFRPGEATYSCRECATDPTCVLCQKCFRKSEHIKHKYKFHSSNGGGCCDCGDVEAWKRFPHCDIHKVNPGDTESRGCPLPPNINLRAEKMFLCLMDYIVSSLTVERENSSDLPANLKVTSPSDKFITVVYNDETHTFDYVIKVLQRAVSCPPSQASDYATIIDREGRSVIRIGSSLDCNASKDIITSYRGQSMLGPQRRRSALSTYVLHSTIVAHQEFSLALLDWLSTIVRQSEGLRNLMSNVLLTNVNQAKAQNTYVSSLMLSDKNLWKMARAAYQQLFMNTVLLQAESKKSFGAEFARCYDKTMTGFLNDDHDHSDSISSMSVQLFTVPTIARYLVTEENLLSSIFDVIIKCCCVVSGNTSESDNGERPDRTFALDARMINKHSNRIEYVFYDLKYILTNQPSDWDDRLKVRFKEFFQLFLKFLTALEGMDGALRKTDRHLEREPEWEIGVTLQMRLVAITRFLLQWCSSAEDVLTDCVQMTFKQLQAVWTKENAPITSLTFNNVNYKCVDYDVTKKPVSVHYPLTRFLAGLLSHCGRLNIALTGLPMSKYILDAADRSFRALALCAQVNAGAWRRNGLGLANQVYYTRHHQCRTESFDRDVQMLQACAALIDPNQFCMILRRKFNLTDTPNFEEYKTTLYEEYLSVIIYVICERYCDGIGQVGFEAKAQREIIHALAAGPKPHSKIQKSISHQINRNPDWERILREVAELKHSPNIKSSAKYELKPAYLSYVSPCFYHYVTATDESNSQTETLRRKKATNQSLASIPRLAPRFTDPFSSVINLLLCPFLFSFVKDLLHKYTPKDKWSDKLFEKILFLIGVGIIEERETLKTDQDSSFRFCEKAEQGGVMDVLRKYAESSELIAPLQEYVCWIVNAVGDVNSRRMGIVDGDVTPHQPLSTVTSVDNLNEAKARKEMAQKMRENLIQRMKQMQKKFLQNMSPDIEEEEPSLVSSTSEVNKSKSHSSVCTGLTWQLASAETEEETDVCILCQDNTRTDATTVVAGFVQLSSVLSKQHLDPAEAVKQIGKITIPAGLHLSSCSHVMHFDCWSQYFQTVKERDEGRYRMRRLFASFSTLKNEFLCPLCSRLSNCVIPIIPHTIVVEHRNLSSSQEEPSIQDWMSGINDLVDPPPPVQQEVVVKLSLTAPNSGSEEQQNFAPNDVTPAAAVDTSHRHKERAFVEPMEVDLDNYQPAFDMLSECISKNCDTGNVSNETVLWLAAAYTFQVTETVARFQGTPLFSPPSIRIKQALTSIVRSCFLASKYYQKNSSSYEEQMKVLLGKSDESILNSNIFCTFVKSIYSCDSLRSSQSSSVANDKNVLFICALAQIVQIILFIDEDLIKTKVEEPSTSMDVSASPHTTTLLDLFNQIRSHAGFPQINEINPSKLEQIIYSSFQPFIKSCALFLRYVTNVSPPESLERNDNFAELCDYLGLPCNIISFFDVNGQTGLDPLVQRWCSHAEITATVQKQDFPTFPNLIKINQLIGMDEDYSDVLAKSSDFVCPRFHVEDDSVTPATCLVCGVMLCSQSYCCQQKVGEELMGACSYHTRQCGFGTGLYLKGRDCTLVLLNQTRGCYRPAPYMDEFGETDLGLRRGNPLKLDQNHLKELNLLWLTHAIPETIVRESESSHGIINFDWVHL